MTQTDLQTASAFVERHDWNPDVIPQLAELLSAVRVQAEKEMRGRDSMKREGDAIEWISARDLIERAALLMNGVHEPCGMPHRFGEGCTETWLERILENTREKARVKESQ